MGYTDNDLKEAANNYYNRVPAIPNSRKEDIIDAFKEGAKWAIPKHNYKSLMVTPIDEENIIPNSQTDPNNPLYDPDK